MSDPTTPPTRPIDLTAILANLQDQLDDLTAAVQAQQERLDRLEDAQRRRGGR